MHRRIIRAAMLGGAMLPLVAAASSHREAPSIAGSPRVDGTDFYMFRSYELGRSGYVTFIANYIPFQDPQGGPNFYSLDDDAVYKINIDNNGGPIPTTVFEFRFKTINKNLAVPSGGKNVPVPLINIGAVDAKGSNVNSMQSYSVQVVHPLKDNGRPLEKADGSGETFWKPVDNIGEKSIPNYAAYADKFVYDVTIPGCPTPGKVFVGQRKEGFFIDIGEIFDLVNLNPVGPRDGNKNELSSKNITSIALEVPIKCLVEGNDPVIGGYTTADLPTVKGHYELGHSQVSRLGMPLVNEVVIGLPDKDKFNGSRPWDDGQFINYVTNPSFPVLLNALFGNAAAKVPATPRNDLVAVFLTGIPKLNQPLKVTPAEMLRLNTSTPVTVSSKQNDLGVLGGDAAGYPNGRRPYDDVVDITLRVAMGAACGLAGDCGSQTKDPNNGTPYTDGVRAAGVDEALVHVTGKINRQDTYLSAFPYLFTPIPGSPQSASQ